MLNLKEKIKSIKSANQFRRRLVIPSDHEHINFASNDYLGLTKHPKILEATLNGFRKFGMGSGGSALVTGYSLQMQVFERALAEWLNVESALVFNSAYHANLGVITSLADRHCHIYSDSLCHASLLDGIRLSRSTHRRYAHNNMSSLSKLIDRQTPDYIVTESVFSMEGDFGDSKSIEKLIHNKSATLITDLSHSLGWMEYPLQADSCMVSSLGKSFNAMGGFVAGSQLLTETILQQANTYRYTTALSPGYVSGLQETLNVIKKETWRREKLLENIALFNKLATTEGFQLMSSALTPIRSIKAYDSEAAMSLKEALIKQGFMIAAIRPPTVPNGTSRLRISLNASHSQNDIQQLIKLIAVELHRCRQF